MKRPRSLVAAYLLTMATLVGTVVTVAPPADAAPASPGQVPKIPGQGLVEGAVDWVTENPECVVPALCVVREGAGAAADAVGGYVEDQASGVIENWRRASAAGVQALLDNITGWMHSTTVIPVTLDRDSGVPEQEWFQGWWWQMVAASILLMVPLMLFAMADGLRKGTSRYAIRAAFGPAMAIFSAMLVVAFAYALSTMISDLSANWMDGLGGSPLGEGGEGTSIYDALTSDGLSPFLAIVLALFMIIVLLILALEMIGINGAIILCCLFMPLAAAGVVWEKTESWLKKATATICGLLLAKLVIFAILGIASSVLTNAVQGDGTAGLNEVLGIFAMLLMTVFSPMMVMRFVGPDGGVSGVGLAGAGALAAGGYMGAKAVGGLMSGGGGAAAPMAAGLGAGGGGGGAVPVNGSPSIGAGSGGGGGGAGGGRAGVGPSTSTSGSSGTPSSGQAAGPGAAGGASGGGGAVPVIDTTGRPGGGAPAAGPGPGAGNAPPAAPAPGAESGAPPAPPPQRPASPPNEAGSEGPGL